MRIVTFEEADPLLDWLELAEALADGHTMPKAETGDTFLHRAGDTLLSRSAWIDGLGMAVKTATVMPKNPARGRPMIHGGVMVFNDVSGDMDAMIDFHLVTKWKTAGDSLMAAKRLARRDSEKILIVGAGTVGRNLVDAYRSLFPKAEFEVWNRTLEAAKTMADELSLGVAQNLKEAVQKADIVSCATMTTSPILRGEWLQPGQHVDLIGAYRADMREADDTALQRARVFVDCFTTTIGHIGEIEDPMRRGVITVRDLLADFYDLKQFKRSPEDITLFKNGGGAHLDLMTARYILERLEVAEEAEATPH